MRLRISRLGLVPAVGEAAHELLVQVGVERHGHLPVRGGVGVFGVDVRRRLVVADVERVGKRPDLVERAAQEQLVARQTGQVERRGRHEEDLVARAREEVFLLAAELEIRDDWLARALEVEDRVAHLLDLAPERRRAGRPDHDARHPAVDLGLAQRVDERADSRLRLEELADDPTRLDLLQIAADPQHERRVALDPRLAAHEQCGEHEARRRDGHRRKDEKDDEDDTAPDCHKNLPWPDRSV